MSDALASTPSAASTRLPLLLRQLAVLLVVAVLCGLGVEISTLLSGHPAPGVAFFPAAGVTLAILLLAGASYWLPVLAGAGVAEISVDVAHGHNLPVAFGFATASAAAAVLSAAALRRDLRIAPDLHQRRQLARYLLVAVCLGPAIGSVISALTWTMTADGTSAWTVAYRWWTADALGVLVVGTAIIAWATPGESWPRARLAEAAALLASLSVVALLVFFTWDQPLTYLTVPFLVWAALRFGARGVAAGGLVLAVSGEWATASGYGMFAELAHDSDSALVLLQGFLAVVVLTALTLAAEVAERDRAEQAVRVGQTAELAAEHAIHNAVREERSRIARELHDAVGHTVNVMVLQAGAARLSFDANRDRSRDVLLGIERTGRDALADLDRFLGLLSPVDGELVLAPPSGLDQLQALVESVKGSGLPVTVTRDGPVRPLPSSLEWSAYRIVQEALTNTLKHAGPARAVVLIRYVPGAVDLEIVDNGRGLSGRSDGHRGRGLIGMQERTAVFGGQLSTGPGASGGFVVRAHLPTS